MYFFDECSEFCRSPGGAVKVPGTLVLRIKLLRGKASGASVNIRIDSEGPHEAVMELTGVEGAYDVYEHEIVFDRPGLYWYHFLVGTQSGDTLKVPASNGAEYQVTAYAPGASEPDWIKGGVIYHIFVDRFRRAGELNLKPGGVFREDWDGCPSYLPDAEGIVRNNDFFGGDFYGIIEKLPYLKQLGVSCIYLSPVFEAASNHKYDTGDFMKIDDAFGGDDAFEKLCAKAGEQGIRIILDGVFNHVGADSRYFNKYGNYEEPGAWQGPQSRWYDWFTFRDDGKYDSWWGIELLPALNKQNSAYRDFICDEDGVIAKWTKKGVSGWRFDVVDELPDAFLYPLCEAIKRENANALIVGEVWENASNKISYGVRRNYLLGGQLDSVTNYPLREAIIACVRDGNAQWLADTMAELCRNYPESVLHSLMNILGTHDTVRILTVLGGEGLPDNKRMMEDYRLEGWRRKLATRRLKMAALLQFTLPGAPCVYYGDEAGMEGCSDPFNRRCYPWGSEDAELLEWYKKLAELRAGNACFTDGAYFLVYAHEGVFAFTRGSGDGRVLIAVNASDSDKTLKADRFNYDIIGSGFTDSLTVLSGQPAVFTIKVCNDVEA